MCGARAGGASGLLTLLVARRATVYAAGVVRAFLRELREDFEWRAAVRILLALLIIAVLFVIELYGSHGGVVRF